MRLITGIVVLLSLCTSSLAAPATLNLVPWPTSITVGQGSMPLTANTRIVTPGEPLAGLAKIFGDEISLVTGLKPAVATGDARPGDISLTIDPALKDEAYTMVVGDAITIKGADYNAVAMATATVLQAIQRSGQSYSVPKMTIEDRPPLKFRGAMIDVARKPHSIETLKAVVEAIRLVKCRYLQLHLTDENAWTFPSTKYPQLSSKSAVWPTGEKMPGYTVEELKELVAFADARGVTIIPELELYGHSGQMRSTMPEVFCFLNDKGERVGAGVINTASDKAYEVLDTLIAEAADIFKSSPYICTGMDEASPAGTENFPEVKALAEREKFPYPHAIFNYHVHKMNEIVKKYGKQMIVWEGARMDPVPLPKDIIFLPWVGESRFAAELDRLGYPFINAPWGTKRPYMDVYEVNGADIPKDSPNLIGGIALSWEGPEEMALTFARGQVPLRQDPTHNPKGGRTLDDFVRRQVVADQVVDLIVHGFTFDAAGLLDPTVLKRTDPMFGESATLTLRTHFKSGKLHYTLDGTEPTEASPVYTKPIRLTASTTVRAKWIGGDAGRSMAPYSRTYKLTPRIAHDGVGAKVTFTPELPGYYGPGPGGLTDGILASGDSFGEPGWIGWASAPVQVNIDLGKPKPIRNLIVRSLKTAGGVNFADHIDFSVSDDGQNFRKVGSVDSAGGLKNLGWYKLDLAKPVTARYVRVDTARGNEWIFMDEILVNGKLPGPNFRHAAMGKPVTYAAEPRDYRSNGLQAATDGYITDTATCFQPQWLGWMGTNLEATVDLGKPTDIKEVGGHFLLSVFYGVFPPTHLTVSVSNDNKTFREVAKIDVTRGTGSDKLYHVSQKLTGVKGRYVKFFAPTNGQWLFADELYVNPE